MRRQKKNEGSCPDSSLETNWIGNLAVLPGVVNSIHASIHRRLAAERTVENRKFALGDKEPKSAPGTAKHPAKNVVDFLLCFFIVVLSRRNPRLMAAARIEIRISSPTK